MNIKFVKFFLLFMIFFSCNLSFGFSHPEIQGDSRQIFAFGAEGQGPEAPLAKRKSEKMPEELESQANEPKTEVCSGFKPCKCHKDILKLIPEKDKYVLQAFLYDLISMNNGCNVLFGDKPAALMLLREEEDFHRELTLPCSYLSAHGFALWQNYFSSFSSNYKIIKIRATNSRKMVILLDKQRIRNVMELEWEEFQKVFPEHNTVEKLHQSILEDTNILGQICFDHEILLGILLGFGKENSALFAREGELLDGVSPPKRLIPSPGFASLEEEMEEIQKKGGSILIPKEASGACCLHWPVGFLVDTTKVDLQELREYYRKQRYIATEAYKRGNYLEVSLQALIGDCQGILTKEF